MTLEESIKNIYTKHSLKLLLLPLVIILLTAYIIYNQVATTGDIFNKDVSLAGGTVATVTTDKPVDIAQLENDLSSKFSGISVKRLAEFGSNRQIGIIVETSETDDKILKVDLEEKLGIKLTDENYSVEVTGSSVGSAFYKQMIRALAISFLFMTIVVFIFFRSLVPGFAAVASALFDILATVAVVNLIGIKISPAGIAAFLMLIGYSVDTDILQTTRVLKKREASPVEGVVSSIKTGLTMTITSIVAVVLGYIFSTSIVFKEMFLIITVGLFIDIIMTYFMNAPLLIAYMNRKAAKQNA